MGKVWCGAKLELAKYCILGDAIYIIKFLIKNYVDWWNNHQNPLSFREVMGQCCFHPTRKNLTRLFRCSPPHFGLGRDGLKLLRTVRRCIIWYPNLLLLLLFWWLWMHYWVGYTIAPPLLNLPHRDGELHIKQKDDPANKRPVGCFKCLQVEIRVIW